MICLKTDLLKLNTHKIIQFCKCSNREKWLLSKSAVLLIAIRFFLRAAGINRVLKRIEQDRPSLSGVPSNYPLVKVAWAVETASRYIPGTTCLYKALITQMLFKKYGYKSTLKIGLKKNGSHQLNAHAWVEIDGQIVVSSLRGVSKYTPLPPLSI